MANKIMFLAAELDHIIQNMFKVFEVLSFLDWTMGAPAKKTKGCEDMAEDLSADWLGVLSCQIKPSGMAQWN